MEQPPAPVDGCSNALPCNYSTILKQGLPIQHYHSLVSEDRSLNTPGHATHIERF